MVVEVDVPGTGSTAAGGAIHDHPRGKRSRVIDAQLPAVSDRESQRSAASRTAYPRPARIGQDAVTIFLGVGTRARENGVTCRARVDREHATRAASDLAPCTMLQAQRGGGTR